MPEGSRLSPNWDAPSAGVDPTDPDAVCEALVEKCEATLDAITRQTADGQAAFGPDGDGPPAFVAGWQAGPALSYDPEMRVPYAPVGRAQIRALLEATLRPYTRTRSEHAESAGVYDAEGNPDPNADPFGGMTRAEFHADRHRAYTGQNGQSAFHARIIMPLTDFTVTVPQIGDHPKEDRAERRVHAYVVMEHYTGACRQHHVEQCLPEIPRSDVADSDDE